MDKLSTLMSEIENTNSTNEKSYLISEFLKYNTKERNAMYLHFISNEILKPPQSLGIGKFLIVSTISKLTGHSVKFINCKIQQIGTTSGAIEYCIKNKKIVPLITLNPIPINEVLEILQRIPNENIDIKNSLLLKCFANRTAIDSKFLSHFILNDLPIGYSTPVVLDAVAEYLDIPNSKIKNAYNFINYIPELMAVNDFDNIKIQLHKPFKLQKANVLVNKKVSEISILEPKLDGMRTDIHITDDNISIFTNNLENVTKAFPEVVELSKEIRRLNSQKLPLIIDTELTCDGGFTTLLTRIQRIENIKEYSEKYPATINVFDLLYCNHSLIDFPLSERKGELLEIKTTKGVNIVPYKFLDKTNLDEMYNKYLNEGYEGIMVKKWDAKYQINNRNNNWLKMKPTLTADLLITNAEKGTGKNADIFASYELSTSEGLVIGNVGIGLSDVILEELHDRFFNNTPTIIEVKFESLQKTTKKSSGYSLRFPRFVTIRRDKTEITSFDEIMDMSNIT